jgi:hypothetical protein
MLPNSSWTGAAWVLRMRSGSVGLHCVAGQAWGLGPVRSRADRQVDTVLLCVIVLAPLGASQKIENVFEGLSTCLQAW